MSDRRYNEALGLGQVAIGVLYCCALTTSIAAVTFIIVRLIAGTG